MSTGKPIPRKKWTVTKTGALSGLRLDEDELPPPGPGEVRVKVRAVGLNFADVFSVLGLYQAAPPTPFVPGLELCGVVESVGPARDDLPTGTVVPSYAPGDACMAVVRFGAYATAVNAPAHQTRPLPREWSHAQGAGFLVQGLTAFYALRGLGDVRRDQKVLVHSAAGGCGTFGVGICLAVGAEPIPVVGSERKKRVVMERFPASPATRLSSGRGAEKPSEPPCAPPRRRSPSGKTKQTS
jgi:NADPH:quinone reductase-like Zn-dependent oxidoreductase